jgi:hypothetical protein
MHVPTTQVVIALLTFTLAALCLWQATRDNNRLRALDIAGVSLIVIVGISFMVWPQGGPRGIVLAGWLMVGVLAAWRIAIEVKDRRRRSNMNRARKP